MALFIPSAFNWATGQVTEQSTNYRSTKFLSDLAVDGIIGPFTLTNLVGNQGKTWWCVYLEKPIEVGYIVIHNQAPHSERLSDTKVVVFENKDRQENRRTCGTLQDMSTTQRILC